MTVFVHRTQAGVGYGTHYHSAPLEVTERTWSFTCDEPGCEERILRNVEHTGRNAASVPLTEEEKSEEELLNQTANKDVAQLAMALGQMAKQGAADKAGV